MAVPDTDQPAARTPAPWWRRRRVWLAIAVFLLVAIRVALPPILRSQIEKQANAALLGHVTVGDVDLWLLRGAVFDALSARGSDAWQLRVELQRALDCVLPGSADDEPMPL